MWPSACQIHVHFSREQEPQEHKNHLWQGYVDTKLILIHNIVLKNNYNKNNISSLKWLTGSPLLPALPGRPGSPGTPYCNIRTKLITELAVFLNTDFGHLLFEKQKLLLWNLPECLLPHPTHTLACSHFPFVFHAQLTDWPTDRLTVWLADKLTVRQTDS